MSKLFEYVFDSHIPGKTIVITAGIHGDEPGGVNIAEELIKYFQQKKLFKKLLKGKLVIIPKLNPTGLISCTRRDPETDSDLNRNFVGNPQSPAEKKCYDIAEQIGSHKPDLIIDLHNDWENSIPYTVLDSEKSVKKSVFEQNFAHAKQIGFPILVETEELDTTLSGYFSKKGTPTLTLEIGGDRTIDNRFTKIGVSNLLNFLYQNKMIGFSIKAWLNEFRLSKNILNNKYTYYEITTDTSQKDIKEVIYFVKPKQTVIKGEKLCEIRLKNGEVKTVDSTVDGLVISHNQKTLVYPESVLYAIGVNSRC